MNAKGNDEAEENRRLKKKLARVTEERDILKNDHGIVSPVHGRNRLCYYGRRRGFADWLLEAFNPVKNRDTWAVARECQEFCTGGHDDEKARIITWLSKKNFWIRRPHSSLDRQTPDQAYFNALAQMMVAA